MIDPASLAKYRGGFHRLRSQMLEEATEGLVQVGTLPGEAKRPMIDPDQGDGVIRISMINESQYAIAKLPHSQGGYAMRDPDFESGEIYEDPPGSNEWHVAGQEISERGGARFSQPMIDAVDEPATQTLDLEYANLKQEIMTRAREARNLSPDAPLQWAEVTESDNPAVQSLLDRIEQNRFERQEAALDILELRYVDDHPGAVPTSTAVADSVVCPVSGKVFPNMMAWGQYFAEHHAAPPKPDLPPVPSNKSDINVTRSGAWYTVHLPDGDQRVRGKAKANEILAAHGADPI